jgi:hypothetical protein
VRSPKPSTVERSSEREDRLAVARTLYNALIAKYPDKSIMLHDDRGVLLAQTDDSRDVTAGSLLSEQ